MLAPTDLNGELRSMMRRLNVASKESVVRQYDHEVQAGSVIKPLVGKRNDGPSDAAVIRPILDRNEAVVISNGICPKYSDIDTYHMAQNAVDEAVRNAVAVGGDIDYMAGLDNFCWCDPVESEKTPDGRHKLAQLVRASRGLYDITTRYGIPMISGKDSMKNDYMIGNTKISIPPTILFSIMGKIDDSEKTMTMDAKSPGDYIYIVGTTKNELGGSEYFAEKGFVGNAVPKVDIETNLSLYRNIRDAIRAGLIASCHDVSDGGIGTALSEVALAGDLGMEVDLRRAPRGGEVNRDDYLLFSESAGRFIITVKKHRSLDFERALKNLPFERIGAVTDEKKLNVTGLSGTVIIDIPIDDVRREWQKPLSF